MLNNFDVKASLACLVIIRDDRLPARRIPLREKPLQRYLLPYRGLLGLLLIAIAWPLSQQISQNLFFPLWLGFILLVDGLVLRRTGTSLAVRSPKIMVVMFIVASPYWWAFEGINEITQNWVYVTSTEEDSGGLVGVIEASLSYSTVIPAVFEVSELIGSFGFIKRFARLPSLVLSRPQIILAGVFGLGSLVTMLIWPTMDFLITSFVFIPSMVMMPSSSSMS